MPANRSRAAWSASRARFRILATVSLLVLSGCGLLKRNVAPPEILSKSPQAEYISSTACYDCHDHVIDALPDSLHGAVPLEEEPGSRMCETCHGPGADHYEQYDPSLMFGIEDWAAAGNRERSGVCLSCHRDMAAEWMRSPHEGDEVSCFNCHDDAFHIEGAVKGPDAEPATVGGPPDGGKFCFQCHGEVEQEFVLQYQHPVTEGGPGCTSCHGVHGEEGSVEASLDVSDVCTKCHVQMEGPWIYEHDAMFEGCTSCHLPHGSPNPKLLVQTGNGLCLQCHIDVTFPTGINGRDHSLFIGSGASCLQCHFEVHGSNASESLAPGH
ncbi:MAG: cytochrome c3 family protein [Deltaproteobacteria bacterium]|nr:cytochrome c3 family protein [Deltaproteobacteria bacterium]